jgi:hypothetical protein
MRAQRAAGYITRAGAISLRFYCDMFAGGRRALPSSELRCLMPVS